MVQMFRVVEGGGDHGFSLKTAQGVRVGGDVSSRNLRVMKRLTLCPLARHDPPATAKLLML
jgi:hypothetical protein